jgi:CDP-4-dehydro-6-deoxyglucose reductase
MAATVRIEPSGREFRVETNESILQAALRSGLALRFACTNGTCGECRAQVKSGEVRHTKFHDFVIPATEKHKGTVLMCCCSAQSDVVLEASEASGPDDIPVQSVRARLYKQHDLPGGVTVVHLRVMRGQALRFLAGQSARLKLSGVEPANMPIASCPCDGLNLEFHFDANSGAELSARASRGFTKSERFEIEGPRGRFVLDEASTRPLIFLAHDTGIAPIKSIIEHAINIDLPRSMHLHWHSSRADGHYLHNYFRSLADALDEFVYTPSSDATGADTLRDLPDLATVDAYLAGNEDFLTARTERLLAAGLPEGRVFVDPLSRLLP